MYIVMRVWRWETPSESARLAPVTAAIHTAIEGQWPTHLVSQTPVGIPCQTLIPRGT